jgi:hypothetical protein
LQVYLCDDRLCYHEPDPATITDPGSSPTAGLRSKQGAAAAALASASIDSTSGLASLPLVGFYGSLSAAGGVSATAASLAALAAGEVQYIALDRIPVRPLPHRQHEQDPVERSHPDVGISLIADE